MQNLDSPKGIPVGKPALISFVIKITEAAKEGAIEERVLEKAQEKLKEEFPTANAVVLGQIFPSSAVDTIGVTMAVQFYRI